MKRKSTFSYDLFRCEGRQCEKFGVRLKSVLFTPGRAYVYFFRKSSETKNKFTRAFCSIILHLIKVQTGIQIPIGTNIDKGLRILHFGTIVVNPYTVIGKIFNIAQGVLIGNSEGKNAGTPVIGDNVYCGANSLILGGVHIGNDVLIAPGAFVNFNVPDNSIVIGNPGKIIPRDTSPTKKYIIYPVEDYEENS